MDFGALRGKTPLVFLRRTVDAAPIVRIRLRECVTNESQHPVDSCSIPCVIRRDVDVLSFRWVPGVKVHRRVPSVLTKKVPGREDTGRQVLHSFEL